MGTIILLHSIGGPPSALIPSQIGNLVLISIDQCVSDSLHAGSKAREDISSIMGDLGARFETLNCSYDSGPLSIARDLFTANEQLMRAARNCNGGDVAVLQFPYRCFLSGMGSRFVKELHKRKARSVLLIHDLDSLRRENALERLGKFSFFESMHCDISFLKEFDCVISHNASMTSYLISMGYPKANIVDLHLFDYLCPMQLRAYTTVPRIVSFAGNLSPSKSGFLYELSEEVANSNIQLHLFGNGYNGDSNHRVIEHGAVEPDELPLALPGGFGLVWDGPTDSTCMGVYGDYLRFNNPHKLSLYYAGGLVPIVWSESAAAEFVRSTNSGFCLDGLGGLTNLIESCSNDEFKQKADNARMVQRNVTSGYYLSTAIKKAITLLT